MNSRILVALLAVFISFGAVAHAQRKTEVKIKTNAECEKCKVEIEKLVKNVKGVKKASLDLTSRELTVTFVTKKTSVDKLREAIACGGWEADNVKPKNKVNKDAPACVNPHLNEK